MASTKTIQSSVDYCIIFGWITVISAHAKAAAVIAKSIAEKVNATAAIAKATAEVGKATAEKAKELFV